MLDVRRTIADAFRPAPGPIIPEIPVTDDWFEGEACRNCGATMPRPYCGECGQKAASRFFWHDIRKESWDRLRLFELQSVKTLGRLLVAPGTVAREYVLGRRTVYTHPLKLLVATVAALVLLLAANRYFGLYGTTGDDAVVKRMAAQVLAYSNWTFSLGILAIFGAAWIVFRGRLGYNTIELSVLAIYCQSIILALIIVNLLPTLIWRNPGFVLTHKSAAQYYVPVVKMLIVAIAYHQFFLLKLRRHWPRLLVACLLFGAINWILLRIYAYAILWLVSP